MLRDKLGPDQVTQTLAAQDAAVQEKIQDLLGPNGVAQYQDYTKNLLSTMTAYLFSGMTTGTAEEKADKYRQLSQVMQEEVQAALASAGLPADYQVVPSLNFRNFASEAEGDQSLNLLDDIYQRVGARAGSFLSADEVAKLQEFEASAISYHRNTLTLGRTMMAPIAN